MKKNWISPTCEITRFDLHEEITAGDLLSLHTQQDGLEVDFGALLT